MSSRGTSSRASPRINAHRPTRGALRDDAPGHGDGGCRRAWPHRCSLPPVSSTSCRSDTFDKDSAYQQTDIDAVRNQLSAPGWSRLVETRSRKSQANVDIYIMVTNNQATGLALIASEPRQFTIVNIVGAIDLEKLHKLEGQFGVPKLDIDLSKAASPNIKK